MALDEQRSARFVRESAGKSTSELLFEVANAKIKNLLHEVEEMQNSDVDGERTRALEGEITAYYRRMFGDVPSIGRLAEMRVGVPQVAQSPLDQTLMYRGLDACVADIVHNRLLTFSEPKDLAELLIAVRKFPFSDATLKEQLIDRIKGSSEMMHV